MNTSDVSYLGNENRFILQNRLINSIVFNKIEYFRHLDEGWDFGYGVPISKNVANKATEIYLAIADKYRNNIELRFDATPMTDGGMVLIIGINDDFINLTINPNLIIDLRWEKGFGNEYDIIKEKEIVKINYIFNIISKIINSKSEWKSSEQYQSLNMFQFQEGFKVIPLENMGAESQSLRNYAQYNRAGQYVII